MGAAGKLCSLRGLGRAHARARCTTSFDRLVLRHSFEIMAPSSPISKGSSPLGVLGVLGGWFVSPIPDSAFVARTQPMYNLTVAQAHTFFVGDRRWCKAEAFATLGTFR
jgi:hypothetical protein